MRMIIIDYNHDFLTTYTHVPFFRGYARYLMVCHKDEAKLINMFKVGLRGSEDQNEKLSEHLRLSEVMVMDYADIVVIDTFSHVSPFSSRRQDLITVLRVKQELINLGMSVPIITAYEWTNSSDYMRRELMTHIYTAKLKEQKNVCVNTLGDGDIFIVQ